MHMLQFIDRMRPNCIVYIGLNMYMYVLCETVSTVLLVHRADQVVVEVGGLPQEQPSLEQQGVQALAELVYRAVVEAWEEQVGEEERDQGLEDLEGP